MSCNMALYHSSSHPFQQHSWHINKDYHTTNNNRKIIKSAVRVLSWFLKLALRFKALHFWYMCSLLAALQKLWYLEQNHQKVSSQEFIRSCYRTPLTKLRPNDTLSLQEKPDEKGVKGWSEVEVIQWLNYMVEDPQQDYSEVMTWCFLLKTLLKGDYKLC